MMTLKRLHRWVEMMRYRFRHWSEVAPYTLVFACLFLITWATWRLVQYPEVGVSWSFRTGVVESVSPNSPAADRLQPGDLVITVDGIPARGTLLYLNRQTGAIVDFVVDRDGERFLVQVPLFRPSSSELLRRLEPLFIASIFWAWGVVVLAFSPPAKEGFVFFLVCHTGSAALTCGALSPFGPVWTVRLFGFLVWWLVPFLIHFHRYFPSTLPTRPIPRRTTTGMYGLAALASLADLTLDPLALYVPRRLWLAVGLVSVVSLLVQAYRLASSPEPRRQIRLVALGAGIALVPFVTFSLLPDALQLQSRLPYEFSFIFLLAIPLAYGYAILRYRVIRLENHVRRGAASMLVVTVLGGVYLILQAGLARVLPFDLSQQPTISLVITLLLAVIFEPMRRRVQILVNHFLYGGWYDYRSAVQQISRTLGQVADSTTLAQAFSEGLQKAMQLKCACLLLPEQEGDLTTAGVACPACLAHAAAGLCLNAQGVILQHFQNRPQVVEVSDLQYAVKGQKLTEDEKRLLGCKRNRLWVPLYWDGRLLGVLVLGHKRDGEAFNAGDLEILEVVVRQASIALENLNLIAELRQRVLESERLHRRAMGAREEERKRVARELHDQIIQSLIGLNYHLSSLRFDLDSQKKEPIMRLQGDVRHLLGEVRRICSDLRPPALDSLGLVPAVRSRLREMEGQMPFRVTLTVEGNEEQQLPEDVALCLFRVSQEALLNAQKHAAPKHVRVGLRIDPQDVLLTVDDDGRGFIPPQRLGQLTDQGHFGLIGLRERLELVNGTLEIVSSLGQGTHLKAHVSLENGLKVARE